MRGARVLMWLVALVLTLGPAARGLVAGSAADGDWPQFRGVRRDGRTAGQGLARSWPEGGPPVVWRKKTGEGYSSVVVAGGRVFVLSADGETEVAIGFEDPSGKEVWRKRIGDQFKEVFGEGPRSTPTVDDGVLYALSSHGNLHALKTADGASLWSIDLVEAFGSKVPRRGFASSPLVDGDLLVIEAGGSDERAFLAVDKKTGDTRWTAEKGPSVYSSGIVVEIDGVRQFVFARTAGGEILSFLPTGEVLWRHAWKAGPIGMPVFMPPNRIFASAAADIGSIVIEVVAGDGKPETREVWTSRRMKNHFSSSLLVGRYLYGFDNATFKCIEAETGEQRWAYRGFGKGSLIAADGLLLVLGDTGSLALVEATPEEYRELGRFQATTGKAWTAPALAHGRLYLRDQDEIACLDLRPAGQPAGVGKVTGASRERSE